MRGRLTHSFRDIIDMRWDEFVAMEQSLDATNHDAIITGIVRACRKGNLRAVQVSLDRLDGKVATEIEVEYPKFYTLFPYATKTADDISIIDHDELSKVEIPAGITLDSTPLTKNEFQDLLGAPADVEEQSAAEEEMAPGSLRAVLERMLDSPKSVVDDILAAADAVDRGSYDLGNPMVKSVIVAGLMKLVHNGRISAVFEVFDQIDGKVADKIKVLGNDVFVKRFDTIAPAGAVKNEDGVYQIASDTMTDSWAARLEQLNKGKR